MRANDLVYLVAIGFGLGAPASRAQLSDAPAPPLLTLSEEVRHPVDIPSFGFSSSQCDGDGDVFFDLTDPSFTTPTVLEISKDGKTANPTPLPSNLGEHGEWHYAVGLDGDLYLLFSLVDKHILIHYSRSRQELSRTSLRLPRYFHTHSFAVSPNGSIFLGGLPTTEAQAETIQIPYTIWLDPSGRLVKKSEPEAAFTPSREFLDGLVTLDQSGGFIEEINSKIRSFDSAGNLKKEFPILKPSEKAFAANLQFVDGEVGILFSYKPAQGESAEDTGVYPLEQAWVLANVKNEKIDSLARMQNDSIGPALCYLGRTRFSYLTLSAGHLDLVEASGPTN